MGWVVNATPRPLYPRERPGTHCIGGWMGPRAGLDGCGKSRPPHRDSIPRTLHLVASRNTDWVITVRDFCEMWCKISAHNAVQYVWVSLNWAQEQERPQFLVGIHWLTFWRRNNFLTLAHPIYKMWIIQEPNMLELWNKLHFEEEKMESIYHV